MRYTIEREKQVRQLVEQGKSSSYISSLTGVPERVIWNWCPETRPHDDVIKWSVKQRFHSVIPELEARISAAMSPLVRKDISEEEWDNLNTVVNKTLFEEAIIVFKNLLSEPPEFGSEKKLSKEPFLDYLKKFWSEDSEYAKRKNLSPVYVKQNHDSVHFWSLLRKRTLSEVNYGDIERVFENLSQKGLSQSRVNAIMKTALIPLKEAYKNGLVPSRCYEFYLPKVEKTNKSLSPVTVSKIFNTHWKDSEAFVANLVGYIGGLQLQEVRALRLCDIGEKTITVNNYYSKGKLIECKNKRVIETSSYVIKVILQYASTTPHVPYSPDSFVFFSEYKDLPASGRHWSERLSEICSSLNMTEKLCFRSWSSSTN